MTGVRIDWELAAFTIMHSKVKDAFLSVTDRDRNLLLVLSWLGFSTTAVDVAHDPRFAGKSSYSLRKLVAYAFDGVFFQTVAPLRWIIYSGFLIAFGAVIAMAFLILQWLRETTYPGWTSLMTVLLFLGGTILASLGIVGIYVGKVFDQVKGRPVYVVDERINAAEEPAG
jgi:dolichol-phosphate mannosyltransferase